MENRPAQRECRMLVAVEQQLMVTVNSSLRGWSPRETATVAPSLARSCCCARWRFGSSTSAGPDARWVDGVVGKDEAHAWPREAGEDQVGQHREETHAGEDFDYGDHVPIVGLRVHAAIANRRQGLDRKSKTVPTARCRRHWRPGL